MTVCPSTGFRKGRERVGESLAGVAKGSGRVWLGSRKGRGEFGWGRERVGKSCAYVRPTYN